MSAAVGAPPVAAAGLPLPVAAVYQRLYSACHGVDPGLLATITLYRRRPAISTGYAPRWVSISCTTSAFLRFGAGLRLRRALPEPSRVDGARQPDRSHRGDRHLGGAAGRRGRAGAGSRVPRNGSTAGVARQYFATLASRLAPLPLPAPGHGDTLRSRSVTSSSRPSPICRCPRSTRSTRRRSTAPWPETARRLRTLGREPVRGRRRHSGHRGVLGDDLRRHAERPSPVTANTAARRLAGRTTRCSARVVRLRGRCLHGLADGDRPVRLPKSGSSDRDRRRHQDPDRSLRRGPGLAGQAGGFGPHHRGRRGAHRTRKRVSGIRCLANAETQFLLDPGSGPRRVTCTDPAHRN